MLSEYGDMADNQFDVVIIGGGIQGAGVAQAAAAAGCSVLLLEKKEPAAGTSSRSSKLIHGGLRYLETAQFSLVRESLHERKLLLKNAPNLVKLVPFYIPIYKHTSRRPWQIRAGLSLYALLGGGSFRSLPRQEWSQFPHLKTDGLQAIFEYHDGQTDDTALTRAVIHSAEKLDAQVLFPATFIRATRTADGYEISYQHDDQEHHCTAPILVNAGGPWINLIRELIDPPPPGIEIDLVQGAHILFDKQITPGILYVEAPADRRAVFIMPWKDKTLVGTTETVYSDEPDRVHPLGTEISYLIETLNTYLPNHGAQMIDSFAGLRVLPAASTAAFKRSREVSLITDFNDRTAYLGIYGGKLTGYRATAEKVLNRLRPVLPERTQRADTQSIELE